MEWPRKYIPGGSKWDLIINIIIIIIVMCIKSLG